MLMPVKARAGFRPAETGNPCQLFEPENLPCPGRMATERRDYSRVRISAIFGNTRDPGQWDGRFENGVFYKIPFRFEDEPH